MAAGDGEVSRRHVLAGAAWAVPAIIVATALPAAAASQPVAGAVALLGVAASMTDDLFRVGGQVSYVDNGDAIPDHSVSSVVFSVQIPRDRLTANPVAFIGPQWQLVGSGGDATTAIFSFEWIGTDLSADNPTTSPIEVNMTKLNSLDPVAILVTADGQSNGDAVPRATASPTLGVGARVVLNSGSPIRYQQTGGESQFIYAFDGTTRWAGPYWPVGADAELVTVTARIPQAHSDGTLIEQYYGLGWSLLSPPSQDGTDWVVAFRYATPLGSTFQNTSTLQFALKALQGQTHIATLRTQANSLDNLSFNSELGPDSLIVRDWSDVPRYDVGGEIKHQYGHPGDDDIP